MKNIWQSLSLRWKLQIGFMAIAMITTIYNRWLASLEIEAVITKVANHQSSPNLISDLQQMYNDFILGSIWEAALQFTVQFFIIAFIARLFVTPLLSLIKSLEAVEDGDLTQKVEVHSKDEIGQIESHFNLMLNKLNSILVNVDKSTIHMGQSAYQIAAISKEIEDMSADEKAKEHEINQAKSLVKSCALQVQELSQNANQKSLEVEVKAKQSRKSLNLSVEQLQMMSKDILNTSEQIEEIVEFSQTITHILKTISEIAEQTNLLALNAAIEAARAGEQGRGFSVVADEVRHLAERSHKSAAEINQILTELGSKVTHAQNSMSLLVNQIETSQDQITNTAQDVSSMQREVVTTSQLNEQIEQASKDQLTSFTALSNELESLFDTLTENSLKISNSTNISSSLNQLTSNLHSQLAGLTFDKSRVEAQSKVVEDNKRKHPRIQGHNLISVRGDFGRIEGLSNDISETGLGAIFSQPLPKDSKFEVEIKIPKPELNSYQRCPPTRLPAKLAWQKQSRDGKFLAGIEFLNLSIEQQNAIIESLRFYNS